MNELAELAQKLHNGQRFERTTVRGLLGYFDQERRGLHVINRIRRELKQQGLFTAPDFANENFDNECLIKSKLIFAEKIIKPVVTKDSSELLTHPASAEETQPRQMQDLPEITPRDAVVTIRQGIPSAGKTPATIRPDVPIMKALTRLMSEKLELLVVQRGVQGRVEGIFSYASFSHSQIAGRLPKTVSDCISKDFIEVNEEKPRVDALHDIMQHGIVVVRSQENQLCGMVTARDVAPVFVGYHEPFLLLGQIENHVRALLERYRLKRLEYKELVVEIGKKERRGRIASHLGN